MTVICLYRPPSGKIKPCIDYLRNIFSHSTGEIWVLGDFNVDFLDRANITTAQFQTLFTTYGLKQLIQHVTRPSNKKGSCTDWIVTNSYFLRHYGVSDDLLSDHLTVYCIRKKASYVYRELRDLSRFNDDVFSNILRNSDFEFIRESDDMDYIWSEFYKKKKYIYI